MFADTLSILKGVHVTLEVTFLGLAFAIPFMLACGVGQYLATGALRFAITACIEFWRSSPLIVLLFLFFYSLPAFDITMSATLVGAMVLGLNAGGYGSQAVRAALQALPRGQIEAGRALGLSRFAILCLIELPQAFRPMLPSLVNQLVQLIKATSLVSLILLADMTYRAKQIAQIKFDPVSVYTGLLLAYFVIIYPITRICRALEKRVGPTRGAGHDI